MANTDYKTFPSNSVPPAPPPTPVSEDNRTFYPYIKPRPIDAGAQFEVNSTIRGMDLASNHEGFAGDGDTIVLPTTNVGSLQYYDNAGVQQWSYIPGNITGTGGDEWVGLILDATDNVLYVVIVDEGPNLYHLASINQAGTIVNIGDDIPVVDLDDTVGLWWGEPVQTVGATMIRRPADGEGNIFIEQTGNGPGTQMQIDITNGSIVGDASANPMGRGDCSVKTPNGNYLQMEVNQSGLRSTAPALIVYDNVQVNSTTFGSQYQILNLWSDCGFTQSSQQRIIQWKGYITVHSTLTTRGPNMWEAQDYFDWVDALAVLFVDDT